MIEYIKQFIHRFHVNRYEKLHKDILLARLELDVFKGGLALAHPEDPFWPKTIDVYYQYLYAWRPVLDRRRVRAKK